MTDLTIDTSDVNLTSEIMTQRESICRRLAVTSLLTTTWRHTGCSGGNSCISSIGSHVGGSVTARVWYGQGLLFPIRFGMEIGRKSPQLSCSSLSPFLRAPSPFFFPLRSVLFRSTFFPTLLPYALSSFPSRFLLLCSLPGEKRGVGVLLRL